jgi:uncharacterized membrane protein YkoI
MMCYCISVTGGRAGRLTLGALVLAAALALPAFRASADHHDHDDARLAVERGEALPLAVILERVRGKLGGEVVGVRFEREDGRWIYEFRVIVPGGGLADMCVDAATGEVIGRESH